MWQTIPDLLQTASRAPDMRLLVVRSANGSSFSAGADIHEMLANKDDAQWLRANQDAIFAAQYQLTRFPLPTIAWVTGDCIGGGCGLALACDIRVASPGARFAITAAKLGLVYPFHDIKLLTDLIGPGQTKRLLYTGELIDAVEAHRIGLAEIITDAPDAVFTTILAASRTSTTAMKQLVRLALGGQTEDDAHTKAMFAAAFDGADFAEGAAAFAGKRIPDFTD